MKQRYRFYACPEDGCPKLGKKGTRCPVHDVEMVEVILRREDEQDRAARLRQNADRVKAAGRKVGESAGKPSDPFGLGEWLDQMPIKVDREAEDDEETTFDDD